MELSDTVILIVARLSSRNDLQELRAWEDVSPRRMDGVLFSW